MTHNPSKHSTNLTSNLKFDSWNNGISKTHFQLHKNVFNVWSKGEKERIIYIKFYAKTMHSSQFHKKFKSLVPDTTFFIVIINYSKSNPEI